MVIFRSFCLSLLLLAIFICLSYAACPNGWTSIVTLPTTQCYKIFPLQKKNFNQSQVFCSQHQNSYLASDLTLANHNALKPYVINAAKLQNAATTFWIGITDRNSNTGPWKWVGGQPYSWSYFFPGTVNTPNKTDCGYVVGAEPNLQWHVTNDCNQIKGIICQKNFNPSTAITPRPTTQAPVVCANGWTAFPQKRTCIRLYTDLKTWFEAQQYCLDAGGSLVKIADSAFNSFVDGLISKQISTYWIGLNDQKHENRFEWLNETAQATFFYWANNEPNNANGNENCVTVTGTNNYKWNDDNCNTKFRYICQQNPIPGATPPTTVTTPSPNCYPGWEGDPNSDNCYQFRTDTMSWLDAQVACQSAQGDLLSITSVQEQFYISARLMSYTSNFFWMGANDRATEKGFKWTDNAPFAFLNWNPGQPDDAQGADCGVISRVSGRWYDFPCADRYGYICKRKGKVTSPTPRPLTSPTRIPGDKMWGCPAGWNGDRGYCYLLATYPNGTDYTTASDFCATKQSYLASIRDDIENRFIFSHIPQGYNDAVWIGLNDLLKENSFVWTDNSPVTYTNWNPGEPNNQNEEDCVTLLRTSNGQWNDNQCGSLIKMVACKKPMSLQPKGTLPEQQGCPAGAIGYNAQCYTIVEPPTNGLTNYNNAKSYCRSKNGYLATADNVQVQAFLSTQLFNRGYGAYWIGLSSANKVYSWHSGRPVSFTSWSNTFTGNLASTCVAMQTAQPVGLWVDTNPCTTALPYICESPRSGFTTPRTTVTTTRPLTCPAGWTANGNLCYKAFLPNSNITNSWMGARKFCGQQAMGATLVSIPNANLENWLRNTLLVNKAGTYWIGLNDRDNEAGFAWTDNTAVTYLHWASGEPNDFLHGEDCVAWTLPSNTWSDSYCYIANSFICQAAKGAVVPTTRPTITPGRNSPQCGNSTQWTQYSGFCYYVSAPVTLATWFEARLACKDISAELVSISSDDENGYVTTMISQNPIDSFWIGLNDLSQGILSWTDYSPIMYVNWNQNEPNDAFGGEQCVEINSRGRWSDQYCQEKRGYVCKRRPGNWTPPPFTTPSTRGGCAREFVSLPSLSKCYYVGGTTQAERKTFDQANLACANMPHKPQLASIHSNLEEKFIMTLIANLQWPAWIGFNDLKVRNRFGWTDNSNVDFNNWGLRQPDENLNDNNPQNRRDCVDLQTGIQYEGKWDDNRCVEKYAYVCETNKEDGLPTTAPNATGCPTGYLRFQNSCYRYYSDNYNWSNAEGYCQAEEGHLVSLNNAAEQAFIEILTQSTIAVQVWVGMTYSLATQSYVWTDSWPVSYTNWGNNQPSLKDPTACVCHTIDGQWQDSPCIMKLPFICEKNLGPAPTPTPTIPVTLAACPDRTWTLIGSNCYYQEKRLVKSWPGANYACNLLGATLMTIHSDDEARLITMNVIQSRLDAWIGLKRGEGMGFAWADHSPVEYTYWGLNEPSDPDPTMHQDCVKMSKNDGTWSDTDCFDLNSFICKKPASYAVSTSSQPTVQINPGSQVTQSNQNTPNNPRYQSTNGQSLPVQFNTGSSQQPTTGGPQPVTRGYVSGNSGSDSGMGGGSIAGIVIGCIAIVAVAATIMFVARKYFNFRITMMKLPFGSNSTSGFDNATYKTNSEDKVNLQFSDT